MQTNTSLDYFEYQLHRRHHAGWNDGEVPTQAYEIVRMETRLEKFAVYEVIPDRPEYLVAPIGFEGTVLDGLQIRMERRFRDNIAQVGLLIEDSITWDVETRIIEFHKELPEMRVLVLRANVICPSAEQNVGPKRRLCSYCGTWSFEDGFHSGTCENCGGRYRDENGIDCH